MERIFFKYFVEMAHSLLQADLVHLDNKLSPTTPVNRLLMPQAVAASYDELYFGGSLFSFDRGQLVEVMERFHTRFALLRLWEDTGWLLLGPYMPEGANDEVSLDSILLDNELPISLYQEYNSFYQGLPVLANDKVGVFFNCLSLAMFDQPVDLSSYALVDMTNEPAPCPVFEDDKLQAYAEMIEKQYELERMILQCVAKGDYAAAEPMLTGIPNLSRVPNQLRNDKNLLIVFNTLLRKTIEGAHVHPLFIDRISGRFAMRIEQLRSFDSIQAFQREMVRDYCEEVKRHSLARFSPNVRRAIEYIQFNLSAHLNLKELAEQLKLNPPYLSSQFNREVGQSLPDYIAEQRIAESCRLIQNTDVPIGQLATAVGFSDINYFSRIFKKKMGLSPSKYRSMLLGD